MTQAKAAAQLQQTIELAPSYKIPLILVFAAIPLSLIQVWIGGAIALFGLFLMFQAATIRLQFTATALDIYRSGQLIRRFPYQEWLSWQIFWQPVPILFYFREVNSIHFLPIIFEPKTLVSCLQKYCPQKQKE
ncbi:DUF3119 family protein [Pleurocapsales cyanobacterium LEGE 06147]|nr:DUF3119 family protein [Pleurocapsales cyanobacterium LEGE 06147]